MTVTTNHQIDASFGKAKRLLNAADYSGVFDRPDTKAFHKNLLLLARKNGRPGHRLGLVIAKKNVRLAVQRNRIKRIAREVFRTAVDDPSMDVVVLARKGLGELSNTELVSLFQQQWNKLVRNISKLESNRTQGS